MKRLGMAWGLAALGVIVATSISTISTPASAAPPQDSILGKALCGLYSLQGYPAKACGTMPVAAPAPKAMPAAPKAAPVKEEKKKPAATPPTKKSDAGPPRGPDVTTSPPLHRS